MKTSEFSKMQEQEFKKNLISKRERLRQLRFNLASGKVKNIREIRDLKKDIARMLTVLNQGKQVK